LALVENRQEAIQIVAQINLSFGETFALGSWGNLQALVGERNGVVIIHLAGVLEAEEILQGALFWPGDVSANRVL